MDSVPSVDNGSGGGDGQDVVTFDSRSLYIAGKPFLVLAGSVHYVRVHPSRWDALFQTFKDAHLNTIETYVFWNHHEAPPSPHQVPTYPRPETPSRCFTEGTSLDLFGFVAAAQAHGLRVILRLGPYVCAEVDYGGFPVHLRDTPGIEFRTHNAAYLSRLEDWVRYVVTQLDKLGLLVNAERPHAAVFLVQLENEYDMISSKYGEAGNKYLRWILDLKARLHMHVPMIMCYSSIEGLLTRGETVLETINAFYAHEELPAFREKYARRFPPVWTECWTGWYDVWGAPHHKRPTADLLYAVARFFAAGGAGVNYYMWMGGTNVGQRSTMYLQVPSYDYDAPVNEFYQHTPKSRRLADLHTVLLKRFAAAFAAADPSSTAPGIFEWPGIAFVCNDDPDNTLLIDTALNAGAYYKATLAPRSVHVVDTSGGDARCVFDTADAAANAPTVLRHRPVATATGDWTFAPEPVPSIDTALSILRSQQPSATHEHRQKGRNADEARPVYVTPDTPTELVKMNGGSSDYAFYVARFRVGAGDYTLSFEGADYVSAFVDGVRVGATAKPLWEDRWSNRWNEYADGGPGTATCITVSGSESTVVELCVLACSMGMVKGDWQLGERNMLEEQKGLLSDVEVRGVSGWHGQRTTPWYSIGKLRGEVRRWHLQTHWPTPIVSDDMGMGWYRCKVAVPNKSHSLQLDLGAVGKGILFVNDVLLGRFWDVKGTRPRNGFLDGSPIRQEDDAAHKPTQRYYHVPFWVAQRDSDNVLNVVLFVEAPPFPRPDQPLRLVEAEQIFPGQDD